MKPQILIVDDDQSALTALDGLLSEYYNILLASSGEEAIKLTKNNDDIATIVMDIKMPGMNGIEAAREIRNIAPSIPVIFHTGYPGNYDEDDIDESEKPFDYIQKAGPISRLTRSIRNAVDTYQTKNNVKDLLSQAEENYGIIGQSEAIQKILILIHKISVIDTKVMITGETGTGKELIARAIHLRSNRSNKRLAILNCNHKAPDLIESELFGHAKGAFTGAVNDRTGLFEYANKGTVFLDEIGDLDITTQAKLLRVLETGEYQVIGAPEIKKTDVRIICATHRNLERMIKEDKFREDLYYRLKGIKIELPPLRERFEDIPLLINKFTDRFISDHKLFPKFFDQNAIDVLISYSWPGNIRQLMDTVESLIITTDSDIIFKDDVEDYLGLIKDSENNGGSFSLARRVKNFRRTIIIQTLHESNNNVSAAARTLGVDRANLRKMIIDHNIELE